MSGRTSRITSARLLRAERAYGFERKLEEHEWDGDELVLNVSGGLTYADGRPIVLETRPSGQLVWPLPVRLPTRLTESAFDVTNAVDASRFDPGEGKLGSALEPGTCSCARTGAVSRPLAGSARRAGSHPAAARTHT